MCIMYCGVPVICSLYVFASVCFVSFCHSQDMQVDVLSSNAQCIQHFFSFESLTSKLYICIEYPMEKVLYVCCDLCTLSV